MSDTTIIASDSLGYDDIYEMESYGDDSRNSCCDRDGAKICVCILVFSVILIVIALVFFIFGPFNVSIFRKLKGQKNGKYPGTANAGSTNSRQGFINTFTNFWDSSSDTADTSYNDQTYDDEETDVNNYENIGDY
ncbi:unnamed protein product [Rotaria sp. Silwood2]|nr:unnamed protein product [Rotaria sp. Silwood2]CAF4238797.1 unnamed protein product [Rotaria sp. Silwood2]